MLGGNRLLYPLSVEYQLNVEFLLRDNLEYRESRAWNHLGKRGLPRCVEKGVGVFGRLDMRIEACIILIVVRLPRLHN